MGGLAGTIGAAIGLFVGTDVDDMIVLTVLFLSARAVGQPRPSQIWGGQYLGIAALVAVSLVAALGLVIVPDRWVGLLGVIPLALGVRGLVQAIRHRHRHTENRPAVARSLLAVAGITIANGGDNIAVYTPVFRTIGAVSTLITIAVFAVGVAVLCLAGSWLGSHQKVIAVVERSGQWLVPAVFIIIGLVIILGSGVLTG